MDVGILTIVGVVFVFIGVVLARFNSRKQSVPVLAIAVICAIIGIVLCTMSLFNM